MKCAAGAFILLAAAALFFFNPAESACFPPCPLHRLTGLHCPGCGSLRALHALLHADLAGAMRMNPLMVLSIPVLAAWLVRPAWARGPAPAWASFAVLVTYGIVRNIPAWPFVLLAPH